MSFRHGTSPKGDIRCVALHHTCGTRKLREKAQGPCLYAKPIRLQGGDEAVRSICCSFTYVLMCLCFGCLL